MRWLLALGFALAALAAQDAARLLEWIYSPVEPAPAWGEAEIRASRIAHRDTLQVIDKETLEVVARLRPEPGKTLAHVEFDRHGRYVLASLWEDDGALIVFDAATLAEVKRIPMRKPVGKYNVHNKITRSDGTSH